MSNERPSYEQLEAEYAALRESVDQLKARIAELERRLGRNSNKSSLPPSRDDPLLGKSGPIAPPGAGAAREAKRSPGKQPGGPRNHLAQVADPDHVVEHIPTHCGDSGASLARAAVTGLEVRQVFDLPEARREVTEHVAQWRRCSCGCEIGGALLARPPPRRPGGRGCGPMRCI